MHYIIYRTDDNLYANKIIAHNYSIVRNDLFVT